MKLAKTFKKISVIFGIVDILFQASTYLRVRKFEPNIYNICDKALQNHRWIGF